MRTLTGHPDPDDEGGEHGAGTSGSAAVWAALNAAMSTYLSSDAPVAPTGSFAHRTPVAPVSGVDLVMHGRDGRQLLLVQAKDPRPARRRRLGPAGVVRALATAAVAALSAVTGVALYLQPDWWTPMEGGLTVLLLGLPAAAWAGAQAGRRWPRR